MCRTRTPDLIQTLLLRCEIKREYGPKDVLKLYADIAAVIREAFNPQNREEQKIVKNRRIVVKIFWKEVE